MIIGVSKIKTFLGTDNVQEVVGNGYKESQDEDSSIKKHRDIFEGSKKERKKGEFEKISNASYAKKA